VPEGGFAITLELGRMVRAHFREVDRKPHISRLISFLNTITHKLRHWIMPRPCQRRRESAAAQRKSKPNPKPSGPPPIRHKARQKAIHNARRGRGGARGGGRGGGRGGRPSRSQGSGNGLESNQDFISFANNGNNFNVLYGAGSRKDPIALDGDDSLDDGEISISDSEEDDSDDSEMQDADALTINVEVNQGQRGRPKRATVMFPMMEALSVYRRLWQASFPLARSRTVRFGIEAPLFVEDLQPSTERQMSRYPSSSSISAAMVPPEPVASSSSFYMPPTSTSASQQPSTSTTTSGASAARQPTADKEKARDYIFDWGAHSGKHFSQVPESYLRTIGGNPVLLDKHPGIKEAFDYHRPSMRRTAPTEKQIARATGAPVQAASQGRVQGSRGNTRPARAAKKAWTTFTFPSGAHANKKLNEVPENYLRTIEGMAHVVNKWVGLKDALLDYNAKTGRQSKIAS
jgi:hypothetical protein